MSPNILRLHDCRPLRVVWHPSPSLDCGKPNNPLKPAETLEEYQSQKQTRKTPALKNSWENKDSTGYSLRTDVNSPARNRKGCHRLVVFIKGQVSRRWRSNRRWPQIRIKTSKDNEADIIKKKGTMGMRRHRCKWSWRQQAADGKEMVSETLSTPGHSWNSLEDSRALPVHLWVESMGGQKRKMPKVLYLTTSSGSTAQCGLRIAWRHSSA
jgi:hypothetical protein